MASLCYFQSTLKLNQSHKCMLVCTSFFKDTHIIELKPSTTDIDTLTEFPFVDSVTSSVPQNRTAVLSFHSRRRILRLQCGTMVENSCN